MVTGMVEAPTDRDLDVQRDLIARILASNRFNKSARLTELFQYLAQRVLEDEALEIHELELGERVFGRSPQYDTTADNIVRVHASLLRKRLAEYFQAEGRNEEFVVEIPRGNYAPIFHRRSPLDFASEPLESLAPSNSVEISADVMVSQHAMTLASRSRVRMLRLFQATTVVFVLIAVILFLRLERIKSETATVAVINGEAVKQFWGEVFQEKVTTDVVMDDASLSLYEETTGKPVPIGEYFDRSYLRTLPGGPQAPGHDSDWLNQLLIRRQSNYADASVVWKLAQMAFALHSDAHIDFARDLSYRQMKSDNLVLLGTPTSNPWIQIFEKSLTLHWSYDPAGKVYYPVDTTAQGQEARYKAMDESKTREGYATVAVLPNLGGSGNTLILSGTGGAALDGALDWLMAESSIEQLQAHLPKRAEGPEYFEALLKIEKGTDRLRSVTIVVSRPIKPSN